MNPARFQVRLHLRKIVILLLALSVAASPQGVPPPWWTAQNVLTDDPALDFAPINQGQLRTLANKAMLEMNARLPQPGAGPEISALLAGWVAKGTAAKDYSAVNVGQLKSVARLFYDRLAVLGMVSGYPWSEASGDDVDFALATIGQAKTLFAFQLGEPDENDLDWDGLPDRWEIIQYGRADLYKNNDDPDGDGLTNAQELLRGTTALDADSDGDGIADMEELGGTSGTPPPPSASSSPIQSDSDDDGLDDGAELAEGTALLNPDTDGDGVLDGADAVATDPDFRHGRYPIQQLAVVDLGFTRYFKVNDRGDVIDVGSVWSAGKSKSIDGGVADINNRGFVVSRSGRVQHVDGGVARVLSALPFNGTHSDWGLTNDGAGPHAILDDGTVFGISTRTFTADDPDPDDFCFPPSETISKGTRWSATGAAEFNGDADFFALGAGAGPHGPWLRSHNLRPWGTLGVRQSLPGHHEEWPAVASSFQEPAWRHGSDLAYVGRYNADGALVKGRMVVSSDFALSGEWSDPSYDFCADRTSRVEGAVYSGTATTEWGIRGASSSILIEAEDSTEWTPDDSTRVWENPGSVYWVNRRPGPAGPLASGRFEDQAALWILGGAGGGQNALMKRMVAGPHDDEELTGTGIKVNDQGQTILWNADENDERDLWQNGRAHSLSALARWPEADGPLGRPIDISDTTGYVLVTQAESPWEQGAQRLLLPIGIAPGPEDSSAANTDMDFVYFTVFLPGYDPLHPTFADSEVEWEIVSGDGTLEATITPVEHGASSVALAIGTSAVGTIHSVRARLKLAPDEPAPRFSTWVYSGEVEMFPGHPAQISITKNKTAIKNDGHDRWVLTATVKDADGNLVLDGSPVHWTIRGSDAEVLTDPALTQEETGGGVARATIVAPVTATRQHPVLPGEAELVVTSGAARYVEEVTFQPLTGTLRSDQIDVDMAAGESALLTLEVDAADGSPVHWFSSNGTLLTPPNGSRVSGGVANVRLTTSRGQLGPCVVSATVGGKIFTHDLLFSASGGLFFGMNRKVLVCDVGGEGFLTVTPPNGIGTTRNIPYHHWTLVYGRGTPNSTVTVTVPTFSPPPPGGLPPPPDAADGTPVISEGTRTIATGPDGSFVFRYDPPLREYPSEAPLTITVSQGGAQQEVKFRDARVADYALAVTAVASQLKNESEPAVLIAAGEIVKDIFFGEVQDGLTIVKNVAKFMGMRDGDPNWAETAWAVGSLSISFIPGGAVAKRAFRAVDGIATTLGKASKFGNLFKDRLTKAVRKDPYLAEYVRRGELDLAERLDGDEVLLRKLDSKNANDRYIDQLCRINQHFGDQFFAKVKTSPLNPEQIQEVVNVFGSRNKETLQTIAGGGRGGGTIETAFDGASAAVKHGYNSDALRKITQRARIDTPNYNRVDLLTDLGKKQGEKTVAEVPAFKEVLESLSVRGGAGHKWEFQDGVHQFVVEGRDIQAFNTKLYFNPNDYIPKGPNSTLKPHWHTDIDISVSSTSGGVKHCQQKSGDIALNGVPGNVRSMEDRARAMENWLSALAGQGELEKAVIRVPRETPVAPHIQEVVKKFFVTPSRPLGKNIFEFGPIP